MTGVFLQVPAGLVVGPLAVLAAVAGVVVLVRSGRVTARRVLTVLGTAGYGAALVTLTYFPLQIRTGDYANRVSWLDKANFIPVLTIDVPTFVLNVLLFAPFGALLPLWRRDAKWTDAARWGLAVSAVVEAGQWATDVLVSSGRTADVNDLIANTAGALLGFWALRASTRSQPATEVIEPWAVVPAGPADDAQAKGVGIALDDAGHASKPVPGGPERSAA